MDGASSASSDGPLWLGSVARRGSGRSGVGWHEPTDDGAPRWLGSVARREGRQQEPPPFEARDSTVPAWLGSKARGRLAAVPPVDPVEPVRGATPVVELAVRREPPASKDDSPASGRTVRGELGMTLRVA
jgi:hypothetical protein